jgi:tRNA-splicing ligase RtcB (3'-phosphate/5'-hydroxy nucleic acid ligase)
MKLEQTAPYRWMLPCDAMRGMRVPGIIYADEWIIRTIEQDGSLQQLANAATLPGVLSAAIAMPDIHFGYGFPIGGILATDIKDGVITPGGVGYDINCGVRLLTTPLDIRAVLPDIEKLVDRLCVAIPCGVGSAGKIHLNSSAMKTVMEKGAEWSVDAGYGTVDDLEFCEDSGKMVAADPSAVGDRAIERGKNQLGTLGSGNHFIEIQKVSKIFDVEKADAFGLKEGRLTIMIHSGSRGLGHQVCTDFVRTMVQTMNKYRIRVPDKQLACVPINSGEGQKYLNAMKAAANFAWANRQCLTHWVRQELYRYFGETCPISSARLVYDVAHNIVKVETHRIDNKNKQVAVHRKGATRAFGPNHSDLPQLYRQFGQPVLIPGDMGTASYVMAGTETAMEQSFGSACHGAGRQLSRKAALRQARNRSITQELHDKGIYVRAEGRRTIAEEMPDAYKDIHNVVNIIDKAGLASFVAELQPIGVVKG